MDTKGFYSIRDNFLIVASMEQQTPHQTNIGKFLIVAMAVIVRCITRDY